MILNEKQQTKKEKLIEKIEKLTKQKSDIEFKVDEMNNKDVSDDKIIQWEEKIDRLNEKTDKIDEKLENICFYFFVPMIDLSIPKNLLELCNYPLVKEEYNYYKSILKDTLYAESFEKVNGENYFDFLIKNKNWNKIYDFRKIVEDEKIELPDKIKKLNSWKFWHPFFSRQLIKNYNNFEKIKKTKLSYGDYLIVEEFSNLGLPLATDLYILGLRNRNDIINFKLTELNNINGFGKKRIKQFEIFQNKVNDLKEFDKMLWKIIDIDE